MLCMRHFSNGGTAMTEYSFQENGTGEGVSQGLSRGLGIKQLRLSLLDEGIGIGVPSARSKTRTYFAKQAQYKTISENDAWEISFSLNCANAWTFCGRISPLLTTAAEKLCNLYMRRPILQPLLLQFASGLRTTRIFAAGFYPCPEIGQATFTYHRIPTGIHVKAAISVLNQNIKKLFILSELGGRYFDCMIDGKTIIDPPSGWILTDINLPPFIASSKLLSGFTVNHHSITIPNQVKLAVGRELASGYAWAGFSYEISGDFSTPFEFYFDFVYTDKLEVQQKHEQ